MTRESMRCEEALELLLAYLDHELDDTIWAEVERHLEHCRGCFSRAEFERKLKACLRGAGEHPAPDRLRARIKQLIGAF